MKGPFIAPTARKGPFIAHRTPNVGGEGHHACVTINRLSVTEGYLRAHTRHGVITAAALEKLGIPQSTTYRRCLANGPWTHLLPGIVLLSRASPTARQRVEAALLHTDLIGIVTGFEAARRYGRTEVPADTSIHVLVPHDHRFCAKKFAIVERTQHFPQRVVVDGVPMAPPARAVLDGVRRVRHADPVRALIIEAVRSGLCTRAELSAELESGSRRGTAVPRATLRMLEADVRSVAEADSLRLARKAGLPAAEYNVRIFTSQGVYVATPDTWWDDVALAWEIDSVSHHAEGKNFADTLARNSRYAAAGIAVVQTLPSRLRTDPAGVVADLRAAYKSASNRPRPEIKIIRNSRSSA
jgi:hypothetical protein